MPPNFLLESREEVANKINTDNFKGDIPVFTISLDFELYWGIFDKGHLEGRKEYFANTRTVIPQMLSLFEKKRIHVTWAIVGMLFAKNWADWALAKPAQLPTYKDGKFSSYRLQEAYGTDAANEQFIFAPELVSLIQQTPFQEVGTHTFSHYYCQEEGQTVSQFVSDLEAAKRIANRQNIALQSLVFPRNQYQKNYLEACYKQGIRAVRSNPDIWFWEETVKSTLQKKVFRTGDAYAPLGRRTSYSLSSLAVAEGMPLSIPASRLLRPVHGKNKVLNYLRLKRVLDEMTVAAKAKLCYHLWWHPHNFGNNPEKSMDDLRTIVSHYKKLEKQFGMCSLGMLEIYDLLQKFRN
ncbi:polysaccharide deacetylase family protein [soil metagenome]